MASIVARLPVLMTTFFPRSTRVVPSASATSIVFGAMKRPKPRTSSAPVLWKIPRCMSTRPSTILRLRSRTPAMSMRVLSFEMPNSSLRKK